ncbi:MAG: hypothetical protein R3318_01345 [Gammaproteobacteria bacterium]|nr:hypothetical protein [Gammaproteobacteria bacterium]
MDDIKINYSFRLDGSTWKRFDLRIDGNNLELINNRSENLPDWTDLEFHKCSHCPLSRASHPRCPVAANLVDVIEEFDGVISHEEIDIDITINDRHITQHTTAQRGLSSMLGLIFATSGCPHTVFLKPMARFHLPLATEAETIFRATSTYLLAQYFLKEDGFESDFELTGLKEIYDNLHILNTMFADRIRKASNADSSVNAVILLDLFANVMPFVIEDHLDEIRYLFSPYIENARHRAELQKPEMLGTGTTD